MVKTQGVSNFIFIKNDILRQNLDQVFDHILEIITIVGSSKYTNFEKSSFRKTVVIYTSSIIEALLLYMLQENKTEEECAKSKSEFKIIKEIYIIDENKKIVLGEDYFKKESFNFKKINLSQINDLCKEHKFVDLNLYKDISKVRDLRNKQHLGSLVAIDSYSKNDLAFVFNVAKNVKKLVKSRV